MSEAAPEAPAAEQPNRRWMVWAMLAHVWLTAVSAPLIKWPGVTEMVVELEIYAVGTYVLAKAAPALATAIASFRKK